MRLGVCVCVCVCECVCVCVCVSQNFSKTIRHNSMDFSEDVNWVPRVFRVLDSIVYASLNELLSTPPATSQRCTVIWSISTGR